MVCLSRVVEARASGRFGFGRRKLEVGLRVSFRIFREVWGFCVGFFVWGGVY